MLFIIFQFAMPVLYIYKAIALRRADDYSKVEKGLSTWRTRKSETEWRFANQYASSLYIIYGVGLALIIAGKYIAAGTRVLSVFNFTYAFCAIAMGLTIVPLTHRKLTEVFGAKKVDYNEGLRSVRQARKSGASNSGGNANKGKKKKRSKKR